MIYIIGFMGSGKTSFGIFLADYLKLPFYDLDKLIESHSGYSINELFTQKGEEAFRQSESATLMNCYGNGVLACGGGVADLAVNQQYLIKQKSPIIWLHTDFSILYQRIRKSARPLVIKMSERELNLLYEKRKPIYRNIAHCTIENIEFKSFPLQAELLRKRFFLTKDSIKKEFL